MTPSKSPHEFFLNLVLGYRSAKVVQVAHALKVFEVLEKAPQPSHTLATTLKTDPHATGVLLQAVAALGLVDLREGRYHNTPLATKHLVPGNPGYLGANLHYQELLWEGWAALRQTVETGTPLAGLVDRLNDPTFSREYLRGVDNASRDSAQAVVDSFAHSPPQRLLDVGCGLGTYALHFTERYPLLRATLLDLPATLAQTRTRLQDHPVRERLSFLEGNYHQVDFGSGYDLVLFSHVTHDESRSANLHLFQKAHHALRPGGWIAVHDFVTQDDGCGPLFATLFSVNMLVYTTGGKVYSEPEYRTLLTEAGFGETHALAILPDRPDQGTRLILSRKPLESGKGTR